jgi:hypothetical protein
MKSSHPPALASWLLEHLVPTGKNEILAGDLLEVFGQRGSAAWYWRQVLAAIIVGFFQELRVRWTGILLAIVLSIAVPWRYILVAPQFRSLQHLGIRLPWPLSLISEIGSIALVNTSILVVAIRVYQVVVRNSNPRKLTQALLVGLSVIALSSTGIFCAPALYPFSLRFVVSFIVYLPLLFGLLISLWIAAPSVARTDSKSFPAQNGSKS